MGFHCGLSDQNARCQPLVWLAAVAILIVGFGTWGSGTAAADAGHGYGLTNVTTNMFTHPWQGGWVTDVGTAWCIVSGSKDPRAVGHVEVGDVPAARGVSLEDRRALAYAIWAYGENTDPVTAAGLATVVHGLSGDDFASVDVPSMAVSHPEVHAAAVRIWNEAHQRVHWLDGPWNVDVQLEWTGSNVWRSTIRYTNASGHAIADHQVDLLAYNVDPSEKPGVIRSATTDANGVVVLDWHQVDTSAAVTVLTGAWGPGYYRVWQGPDYPSGAVPQQVVTAAGVRVDGGASKTIPTGRARVSKTTTNPAYQSAAGATFEVVGADGTGSFGTLVVGEDGMTADIDLMPGRYRLVERSAPTGVKVDPDPHEFVVESHGVVTIELTDDVERAGRLSLVKLDEYTGERVPGAVVEVARDSSGRGTYDEVIGTYTLDDGSRTVKGLAAGVYRITEVAPPPGYLLGEVTTQFVVLTWDQVAEVTFSDHAEPTVSTYTASDGVVGSTGDIAVAFGASVRDVVVVNGLGPDEKASVATRLYGPFSSLEEMREGCIPESLVASIDYEVVGSGEHASPAFVPEAPGMYGFVATLSVPGLGEFGGVCGEPGESVSVATPGIITEAQAQEAVPGGSVSDLAHVEDLAPDVQGELVTTLYGPFEDDRALAEACEADYLGDPVATVTDSVTGSGRHRSSTIDLARDRDPGVYTFMATLHVPGLEDVSHGCGEESETFTVAPPAIPRSDERIPRTMPTLPRTGWPVALVAASGVVLVGAGLALSSLGRRVSPSPWRSRRRRTT